MQIFSELRSLRRALCVAVVGMLPSLASAAVFDNGMINDVDYAAGNSIVRNSISGQATTVNALAGGTFFNGLGIEDTSIANFYSGSAAGGVSARDQSEVTIHGGSFEIIDATDSSSIFIQDGTFTRGNNTVRVFHDSAVAIAGGTFTVLGGNMVVALDNGSVTITGGTFTGGRIYNGDQGGVATVDIHGGTFLEQAGEGLAQIINVYNNVTTIYGQSFNLPFGVISDPFNGTLSGVLANGDAIEVNLINNVGGSNTGKIVLVQSVIPEPASLVLLTVGLTVIISIRRRSARNSLQMR